MLHRLKLPFSTNLASMLLLMGERCSLEGRGDLAGECMALAAKAGAVKMSYQISAADLLCAACDTARQRGDDEMVAALERLVLSLKQGQHATVTGVIHHTARTTGELDGALEKLRGQMIRGAGG